VPVRRHNVEPSQVFGYLTVIDPDVRKPLMPSLVARNNTAGPRAALCRCECGHETIVLLSRLVLGRTVSCGCAKGNRNSKPYLAERNHKHGLTARGAKHPLYGTWLGMVHRCHYSSDSSFYLYGARGIAVHAPWRDDPRNFIAWIDANLGPKPGPGYSLDRIDSDGNYEPGNLRWATASEQQLNRRDRR
jgi:hypothetical protein